MSKDTSDIAIKNLKKFLITSAKMECKENIPTGHFELDFIIHYGENPQNIDFNKLEGYDPAVPLGLPLGKVVEIYGSEGGGKSSLAHRVAGFAQKMGHTVAWFDTEKSYSEHLAKINGCVASDVVYFQEALSAEDVIDCIKNLCKAEKVPVMKDGKEIYVNAPKVIIVDSVAALTPKARAEASADQHFMAVLPRILSENLGNLTNVAFENNVLIIFINQIREKVGQLFGNPETTPGGRALKHFASIRIKVTRKKSADAQIHIEDEDTNSSRLIGGYSSVYIEKNRFAKPYVESLTIPIYYEPYFPDIEEIVFNAGRQSQIISVRKGVYTWNEIKIEGRNNFIEHIKNNNLLNQLISDVKIKAEEKGILLPPEIIIYKGSTDDVSRQISGNRSEEDNSSGEKKSKKRRGEKSLESSSE